ncbi:hypothetical protein SH139x_002774 [Planctomycetaceae bacterium SH139]
MTTAMITAVIKTKFDTKRLQKRVEAASFRSLGHAGGAIRLTASRSIRRRKNPSPPGRPPHTQTGRLKRAIRYEVQPGNVVIGPVNEIAGKLWNLHEFGGRRRPRRRRRSRRLRQGDFGPIRLKTAGVRPTYHRIRLTTAAQVSRASALIAEHDRQRNSQVHRYPKRPFMQPALTINRPRLPRFWANSVK